MERKVLGISRRKAIEVLININTASKSYLSLGIFILMNWAAKGSFSRIIYLYIGLKV